MVQTYDKKGNPVSVSFAEQNSKRAGQCATWALWMSIGSLLIVLLGQMIMWFVIIVTYYLAILGLKSPKRNTAIVAIVITSIGTLIALLVMAGVVPALT